MSVATEKSTHRHKITLTKTLGGILLCALPLLMKSSAPPSLLEQIISNGILNIVSNNGPVTYYEGPFGLTGFEYDLANAFAEELGVELVIHDEGDLGNLIDVIGSRKDSLRIAFAANHLTITDNRQQVIDFSKPYLEVTQQVIYQRGNPRPTSIEDLIGQTIVVLANSAHAEQLTELKADYPDLTWAELVDAEPLDLLETVHSGKADIAIVDSAAYTVNRMIYPRARYAFDLTDPQYIAWGFPKKGDKSLLKAANRFIHDYKDSGNLDQITQHYFEQSGFDEGGALSFSIHLENRLPQWEELFREAATEFDLDWLFIAAVSYQESLWNANARSYTGVRGLMMLTLATAKELGVTNRRDPKQSIFGGTKYLTQVMSRIPERIQNPDRQWMALAAYNIGFGHLEDARRLTEAQGGNPDIWDDVKERLPLLSKKKYYQNTRHGYARGWEPVQYVENIRNYYQVLVWHHESEQRRLALELQNQIQDLGFNDETIDTSPFSPL